jgi:transposase
MGRLDMHTLQEFVRLARMGTGFRAVARMLRISPNTEREYRKVLEAEGLLVGDPNDLPELAVLQAALEKHRPARLAPQQESSIERWSSDVKAMQERGAKPVAIFDRLRLENNDFAGSLSAIKRMCRRLEAEHGPRAEAVAIPVETLPGQVAQVDFGDVGKLYDPKAGVLRRAYVFVMVLGYSRHMFARIVFDQSTETWIRLHMDAFESFGGVPAVIVPDNLKAAVIRAAFAIDDKSVLNRSYRELARHYGCKIDPAPPYTPEHKGKVESAVKYVKHNFMRPRDELDVSVLRPQLDAWVEEVAGQRVHGTTRKAPRPRFEAVERAALLPLPQSAHEVAIWHTAKVHTDSHVVFDKAMYSVPWRFVGKQVTVRACRDSIALFFEDMRIATHERAAAGKRRTHEAHLPEGRRELRHRSQSYWEERADAIGDDVGVYIREVFASDDVLLQLRTVQAIVTYLEGHPAHRARAACARARYFASYSYGAIKNILRKGLDLQPLPGVVLPERGRLERPRLARDIKELLAAPLEDTDAPH